MATKKHNAETIVNPFKQNCKHDFVFNLLLNGLTFEQLRTALMEKYNDVHTCSKPNTRMYLQNIRNKNIPVSYTHQTGIYKIGNPEPKPETKKRNRKPVKPEIDLNTETKPNNPETVQITVSNETPSNPEIVSIETKPETPNE